MLLIIDMMLSVIPIPGRDNLLLFPGCRAKGEALRGQRLDPACVSPVFSSKDSSSRESRDRFSSTDEALAAP
jgi:hypothetical protein